MLVEISKVERHSSWFMLTFANNERFMVMDNRSNNPFGKLLSIEEELKFYTNDWSEDPKVKYPFYELGNYEVNQKLFQYFNHKFTHSALCQKQQQQKVKSDNE